RHYERGESVKAGERHYDRSGTLLTKTDCDDARSSCTETEMFDDGKTVKRETFWKQGKVAKQTDKYQNGKPSKVTVIDGDHFAITVYFDTGTVKSRGRYVEATDWFWQRYIPDGIVETFREGGGLWMKETYARGRRQGPSVEVWETQGHKLREEA